jgi:hypothetical protein
MHPTIDQSRTARIVVRALTLVAFGMVPWLIVFAAVALF